MNHHPSYLRQDIKEEYHRVTSTAKDGDDLDMFVETNNGNTVLSWKHSTSDWSVWRNAVATLPPECWGGRQLSRDGVYRAISAERDYQDNKWGINKQQSIPGFLLIIRKELEEAEAGWMKSVQEGRHSVLAEITQIAATAVACLEKYGTEGLASSTNDIP